MAWNVDPSHGEKSEYESPLFFDVIIPPKPKIKQLCITCTNFECEITDRESVLGCDEWEV